MILVEYEVGNFKAVGSVQKLKLSPLTLIFGKNSAGKSSILQSLLLCQNSLKKGSFNFGAVTRWGQIVDLGDFRQYVHRHNTDSTVSFGFRFERTKRERTSSPTESKVERSISDVISEPLWSFCFFNDVPTVTVRFDVRLFGEDNVAGISEVRLDVGGDKFLEFARDESGNLALVALHLDQEQPLLAFASFIGQLSRFDRQSDAPPQTLDEILQSLNISSVQPPADLVARVERLYHLVQSEGSASDDTESTPSLKADSAEIADLLGQSDKFAALASAFGVRLLEVSVGQQTKAIRLGGKGLNLTQIPDTRLPAERVVFNRETLLEERLEAIEDPIGFYMGRDDDDALTSLAKSLRFDLELLIESALESTKYWLLATEYVGPIRWVPKRLSTSTNTSREDTEGGEAFKLLVHDRPLLGIVSRFLQDTLATTYSLRHRTTAPAVDQQRLREELLRAVDLFSREGAQRVGQEISNVFNRMTAGRTGEGLYLVDTRNDTELDFCDVGFGIGQVLPLLIEVAKTRPGMVCVEQPEAQIHPAMQAALGDVFIQTIRSSTYRKILLLETHSEHIILRLSRRVRETTEFVGSSTEIRLRPNHILAEELAVHWVEMVEGQARITKLGVMPDGDFERNWPEGFFEERFADLPL
jgi:AAA ATPase domain/Protein of unknown function (DUF3696)